MNFRDYLIEKKVLKKEQIKELENEIKNTGLNLEELILKQKFLEEKQLFELKSEFFKIPLKKILTEATDSEVFAIIPKESAEFYKMIPLALNKEEKVLEVGMVFPEDVQAQEALKFLARQQNVSLKIFLITLEDFAKYLNRYQTPEREVERVLERLKKEDGKEITEEAKKDELGKLVEEAPIIKMVGVILRQALEGNASDIHIEPTSNQLKIRYRLNGILYPSLFLPINIHLAVIARIKILSNLKIDETRLPQDGRFSTKFENRKIDFRVSTFPTSLGEKVVIRILDSKKGLKSLNEMGLQNTNLEIVEKGLKKPYGLILSTGPTGCGKTTTLYGFLKILNKEEVNIVTLEDPIEYFIEGINQSQVRPDIDYTFAKGLRQILRQDPDIIMVGEIRDNETAALAIHAALTGHLVISTLHTSNVLDVIPRLIDMEIKPFLIPVTLTLAVNQRLVRTLCPDCKKRVKASKQEEKYILNAVDNLPLKIKQELKIKLPIYIYNSVGCKKCNSQGYTGRIGIFEVIQMTDNLAKIILENPVEQEIFKEARQQGMITMAEDGILKVLKGITSLQEIMRVTEEV